MRGIYKSTDGGETWTKKDKGVTEWDDITFRGFAVRPGSSSIVFAAAEIHTGIQGSQFEKVKGKIYKSADGGENWRCVWEGTSLARFVLISPQNPDIMYASTGIFDREAYNDAPVGVLKSTDGGETWRQINSGIDNLFVGFLEMHPTNSDILFAAAGNCIIEPPGVGTGAIYRTTDGGEHWKKVLGRDRFSVVTFSPSNPDVIYAAGCRAFFRSDDSGDSWKEFSQRGAWGPPGMKAGQPIGIVADPDDPMMVYVNNYTGGVFKSTDGGETWVDWSHGYTGADMYTVTVAHNNPKIVYAGSRSGPFRSYDGGTSWAGLLYPNFIGQSEVPAIAVNPQNPGEVLASDAQYGYIFSSRDGGNSWQKVYHHPKAPKSGTPAGNDPRNWHRFTCIAYAPSNPEVVYAGIRKAGPHLTEIYYEPSFGIVKSSNGGNTWTEINVGLEDSKKNINCIAVHPQNPNIAYAGTLQDGVFKTTNGGEYWVPMNNGLMSLDVRSLAIDPENPEIVYAGLGEGAGLYKTTNGGELWEGVNYGIRVECPSYLQRVGEVRPGVSLVKPKRLVGGDYVSVPWTVITSIAIDPEEPQTVYAADYFLGVYLSTDGGLSWDTINDGLLTKAVTALALSADGWVLYAVTAGDGVFKLELW
ncbi:Ycf48-like protein [subsurface metagenome]